jgi:hypothetical protein
LARWSKEVTGRRTVFVYLLPTTFLGALEPLSSTDAAVENGEQDRREEDCQCCRPAAKRILLKDAVFLVAITDSMAVRIKLNLMQSTNQMTSNESALA